MTSLFISDMHLDAGKPHLTSALMRFLAGPARQADALYILGDAFDSWIGDDHGDPLRKSVEDALKALAATGVSVYFMVGNRDFLVRQQFAQRAGVALLDDPTVVTVGGVRTLLSHGDRYCTDDVRYMAFREKSRTDAWQNKVLGYPRLVRVALARYARWKSVRTQAKAMSAGFISDVNESAVLQEITAFDVTRVIHGHTHRPKEHTVRLANGGTAVRIVLSDWREQGEALEVRDDGSFVRMTLTP